MWLDHDRYIAFLRYPHLHSAVAVPRRIARSTKELEVSQRMRLRRSPIDRLPSDDIDAPESLKSLSPICIGNTLRAGSTIGVDGSVMVRLVPPSGLG